MLGAAAQVALAEGGVQHHSRLDGQQISEKVQALRHGQLPLHVACASRASSRTLTRAAAELVCEHSRASEVPSEQEW